MEISKNVCFVHDCWQTSIVYVSCSKALKVLPLVQGARGYEAGQSGGLALQEVYGPPQAEEAAKASAPLPQIPGSPCAASPSRHLASCTAGLLESSMRHLVLALDDSCKAGQSESGGEDEDDHDSPHHSDAGDDDDGGDGPENRHADSAGRALKFHAHSVSLVLLLVGIWWP